jgi:glycosyltransferase involved in cell wall biosynthesis
MARPASSNKVTCAAVIPCLNEESAIGPLVSLLRKQLAVVVVVDDGSTDQTALKAKNSGALVLRHERNCGKGAALRTGLSQLLHQGHEWAVTLDGDGQHDPADLPALLQCARQTGALLVIGNRMPQAHAMPWLRRWVNRWMSRKLSQRAGCLLPDTQSGFRLVHLPTWASLRLTAQHFEIESEMLLAFLEAKHSVEFTPVRVCHAARKSRIHPVTDTLRWFKWWQKRANTSPASPQPKVCEPAYPAMAQKI